MKLLNRIQRLRLPRAKKSPSDKSVQSTCSTLTDNESIASSSSSCFETAEELAGDYLTNLRSRFQEHVELLLSQEEQDDEDSLSSLQWANYWIQDETEFLSHHEQSLLQMTRSDTHFQQSYLRWRKERVLNFLWKVCRDESNMTIQQIEQAFETFVNREIRLLELHAVKYICCSSRTPFVKESYHGQSNEARTSSDGQKEKMMLKICNTRQHYTHPQYSLPTQLVFRRQPASQ